jgi:hypothetical protein
MCVCGGGGGGGGGWLTPPRGKNSLSQNKCSQCSRSQNYVSATKLINEVNNAEIDGENPKYLIYV